MNDFPPEFRHENSTIAIDFDGVIHNDNKGYYDGTIYGEPIPGSLEALKNLASQYKIVIFTAKARKDRPLINGKDGITLVKEWLQKHNVEQYVSEITAEKPRAKLYIDDKGYRFDTWERTIEFINFNASK